MLKYHVVQNKNETDNYQSKAEVHNYLTKFNICYKEKVVEETDILYVTSNCIKASI